MLMLLLACTQADLPAGDDSFYAADPLITAVTPSCDADTDTRSLRVDTQGWTAGGLWSMTTDSHRVEAHSLISIGAAPDGTWDQLALDLEVLADVRDVEPGTSTGFLCDAATEAALSYRLVVYDADSNSVTDCRVWGRNIDWNSVAGYSACDKVLE